MDKLLKKGRPSVIGMVHCLPLPGTAGYGGDMRKILEQAVADAICLEKAGCDALIIENMGDSPFGEFLDVAQSTALAAAAARVSEQVSIPVGIDAAMNDYRAAISIAQAVSGRFVRLPVFVDTVEYCGCGMIEPCARKAMQYRKALDAEHIMIFADIHVKHTHMVLKHVSIEDSAKAARDCGADAIIVTGTHIGVETPVEIIERVKKVVDLPVIAGSGVNTQNIRQQLTVADGAIVGSGLKAGGKIENPISFELTSQLIRTLHR